MKRSFESGYAKWKKTKEQEERIKKLPKLTTFFSKTTTDTTSTSTSTLRLVSSITEEKEERAICIETCSDTAGEGTTSDISVNVSEQQSENIASSDPVLWPSTNKNSQSYWAEKGPPVCQNKQCSFIQSARVSQLEIKILKQDI
jgi:hypothetical protein